MTVAVEKVHRDRGVWNTQGGWEYPAVLTTAAFAITALGPGRPSVDASLGRSRWGRRAALTEIAAGVAGGFAMIVAGRRRVRQEELAPATPEQPSEHVPARKPVAV